MKIYFSVLISVFWYSSLMAETHVDQSLNQYSWEKRQLIVFTPNQDHAEYLIFKQALKNSVLEIEDRKLHTWHVVNNEAVTLDYQEVNDFTSAEIRSNFNVDINDFSIVLIGYDQEEKLRLTRTDLNTIFDTIDQMPMRIQELSNQ